jgi:hypothetical protein
MTGIAVCAPDDPFIDAAVSAMPSGDWRRLEADELALRHVTLDSARALFEGREIDALYWAPPWLSRYSGSFDEDEKPFIDHETVSLWSAVAASDAVKCNVPPAAFHAFQSSRWLHATLELWNAGAPAVMNSFGGPGNWAAHCTPEPFPIAAAAVPGAVTAGEGDLSWYWSGGETAYDEGNGSEASAGRAFAAKLSNAGFQHTRFALDEAGKLAVGYPVMTAHARPSAGRMAAAAGAARWYAS